MRNVWNSNLQIVALVTQLQTTSTRPDTSHTWFQEPARFEDALGRILPIPSEYAWSVGFSYPRADSGLPRGQKVKAIIVDQFSHGPGSDKVKAGEYLLYNVLDDFQVLSFRDDEVLIPGMSIRMTLVVGRYEPKSPGRCPRAGCKSTSVKRNRDEGNFW